ncbi:hypothetical protein [Dermatophilus congolensis]|uniref:hypothetical protein n=1 Tax=Dermatophilus congolensis TaxID=1863 RepID=UPI001AAF91DA|nr:hypothetical protein [Dermatophilus congolensis]
MLIAEWHIKFSHQAREDAQWLASHGLKPEAKEVLELLSKDPFATPPPYKKLGGSSARYSRQINEEHSIVYDVLTEDHVVHVLRMRGQDETKRPDPKTITEMLTRREQLKKHIGTADAQFRNRMAHMTEEQRTSQYSAVIDLRKELTGITRSLQEFGVLDDQGRVIAALSAHGATVQREKRREEQVSREEVRAELGKLFGCKSETKRQENLSPKTRSEATRIYQSDYGVGRGY